MCLRGGELLEMADYSCKQNVKKLSYKDNHTYSLVREQHSIQDPPGRIDNHQEMLFSLPEGPNGSEGRSDPRSHWELFFQGQLQV